MHGSSVPAAGSFGCGCGGCWQTLPQRRIALSFAAALPSGRGRGKGAAAGRVNRIRRWGKGTIRIGAERLRRTADPCLGRGSFVAAARQARRRRAGTAEASPAATGSRQETDDRSRTMGKGTIPSTACQSAETPLSYVSVDSKSPIARTTLPVSGNPPLFQRRADQ